MLLKQLHRPHATASARPRVYTDIDAEPAPYPDDELADPETDRTNLKEPECLDHAIPNETLEFVAPGVPEKKLSEYLNGAAPSPRTPADSPTPSDAPHLMRGPDTLRRPGPVSDPVVPPEHEAEAIRLTQRAQQAKANGDPIAELDALDELVKLYAK